MINKRHKILITNDDGIFAPGIKTLWRALKQANIADLFIIAPAMERSGAGSSLTWDKPVLIQKADWEDETPAWSVDGTPADCVKMASRIILDSPPDFIVAGINAGSNAGRNVLHSGTVGAVIEGVFRGIPGVALSCENGLNPNFHVAEKYVKHIVEYLFANPLPSGCFLNVNFPESVNDVVKGFKLTRQGRGRWVEEPSLHFETKRGPTYWLGGKPEEIDEPSDCDMALLREGYMTAVPIHVHELTDHLELDKRKQYFEKYFAEKNGIQSLSINKAAG